MEFYMSKQKLFISQPMRNMTENDILDKRKKLYKPFKDNYILIDSYFKIDAPNDNFLWYLGESIKLLGEADLVLFDKDWQLAPGCRVERIICSLYNIPMIEEFDENDIVVTYPEGRKKY